MTIFETLGEIGTLLGGAAGGGGVVGGLVWLGGKVLSNRKHARNNAAMVERTDREARAQETVAREAGAAAVVDDLLGEMKGYRVEVRDLREQVATSNERCEELRKRDRAEMEAKIEERDRRCEELRREDREQSEKRLDALRADLGAVAARVRDSLDVDSTGVHQLERIVRKSPTPPEPLHAIPPPPRGKETDR